MAGKGGGGAWKVAYADFVTAMMAFFLVMWICGQDQKVRRSVSDYFSDPIGSAGSGSDRKVTKTGAVSEQINSGTIPYEDKVAFGQGRKSFSRERETSPVTKLVNDWIHHDKPANDYWHKQAKAQRESARWSKDVRDNASTIEKVATRQLVIQLQEEFKRDLPGKLPNLHRDLLHHSLSEVNWNELAEDLIGH